MKKALLPGLLMILALTLSAHLPVQLHSTTPLFPHPSIQSQLDALTKRGFTYRLVDPMTIELTEEWSGMKQVKSLMEPSEIEIHAWAADRGVPIIEIDPTFVDTARYSGWFVSWIEVPLSNNVPFVVADIDHDGNAEVYGIYKDTLSDFQSRVYEVTATGNVQLAHEYVPRRGSVRSIVDADRDSLTEVVYTLAGGVYNYEQFSADSLPTVTNFEHERHWNNWDPGFTGILFGSFDSDSLVDLLYKGSEQDSSDTTLGASKIYATEFNATSNNFVRVWSTQFYPGAQSGIGGFVADDFDRDGRWEFVCTDLLSGQVYNVENTGDNTFAHIWTDDTPFVNMYYQGAGDIDNDGKSEFYAGATMSTGNWTTMYEADGNNQFSPRLILHLLSGGTFDEPTYLTKDIDHDGKPELIIFSGVDLYILKSMNDDDLSLWYYKREDSRDCIQVHDFNKDGINDLIIGKRSYSGEGQVRYHGQVYTGSPIVGVDEGHILNESVGVTLEQNSPNPFNSTTVIRFYIPQPSDVQIRVYTILGEEVEILVNEPLPRGEHTLEWDASLRSTGVYLLRIETPTETLTRKLLLLR